VLGLKVGDDDRGAELLEVGFARGLIPEPVRRRLLLGSVALRADPVGLRRPLADRDRAD
jgi:hypothetical protein